MSQISQIISTAPASLHISFVVNALLTFLDVGLAARRSPAQMAQWSENFPQWTPVMAQRRVNFVLAMCIAGFTVLALVSAYTFRSVPLSAALGFFLVLDSIHTIWVERKFRQRADRVAVVQKKSGK